VFLWDDPGSTSFVLTAIGLGIVIVGVLIVSNVWKTPTYKAKRSQLVADLADQVQDHACQGDGPPVWASAGSHPTALVGDIAVWRAANGINPQDPRPTGGSQLGTLPALWKQRLDRHIARATNPPADARANKPQAGRTALSQRLSAPSAPGR
jgi:hypothetical protein